MQELAGEGKLQALASVPMGGRGMEGRGERGEVGRIGARVIKGLEIGGAKIVVEPRGVQAPKDFVAPLVGRLSAVRQIGNKPVIIADPRGSNLLQDGLDVGVDQVIHGNRCGFFIGF